MNTECDQKGYKNDVHPKGFRRKCKTNVYLSIIYTRNYDFLKFFLETISVLSQIGHNDSPDLLLS